jgi:hypothetical protein
VNGLSYFIGEAIAKLWECFVIEHAPYYAIIKSKVTAFELGYAIVSAICHVEEAEVRKNADKNCMRVAGDATLKRML